MWGFSIVFLETVILWATILAATFGALSIICGFIAGFVGYKVSNVVQQQNEVKISEANAQAEKAKLDSAEANARAAEAALEQEKLKAQFAWREITTEQASKILSTLKKTPDEIVLKIVIGDPETLHFAKQISKIFRKAGWKVSEQSMQYDEIVVFGVYIPESEATSTLVRSAFDEAGIDYFSEDIPTEPGHRMHMGWGRGSPSPNALRILIAPKKINL